MLKIWRLACVLLAFGALGALGACTRPKSIDDAFGAKVRIYLLAHPEILDDMTRALETRRQEARAGIIQSLRPQLEADASDPSIGPADAPITLVEFFDYQCGFCRKSIDYVAGLRDRHPDIRIVFKEFPIFGEASIIAARASLAAARQGKYFDFHARLLRHTGGLTPAVIQRVAQESGLDLVRLNADMRDAAFDQHLAGVDALARRVGVDGTPSFFINGAHVPGADFDAIEKAIAAARAAPKAPPQKG